VTDLSLPSEEACDRTRGGHNGRVAFLATLLVVLLAAVAFLGYQIWRRAAAIEGQLSSLSVRVDESSALSRQAMERATAAESAARAAAEGRQQAETQTDQAQAEADAARQEAASARETAGRAEAEAERARTEAERIRKQAEAELNRLEKALSQVAETRRTALGLVMNLNSDYLKFDFDKADLHQEDNELLSRVAGILLASPDYTVSVNGHTDDVGTDEYNQKLSERRAQAVRDYLVKAGLPPEILSVTGHGKKQPLVPGTSEAARAKNRRVELGIVNTRILYGRPGVTGGEARFPPGE
jgi:outer membrane protein OmpA-like peptidoglycan-associated protein